ncbi:MAG: hypothetical protein JEY96_05560 [Bacteroidales bacterium]|nr:hypothetical protein [Bacteroidales bacterium]
MKKLVLIMLLAVTSQLSLFSQEIESTEFRLEKNAIQLNVTNMPISIALKTISNKRIASEISFGIAALNNDTKYDDYIVNLKLHYLLKRGRKTNLYTGIITGIEFVNDPTFDLTTPFIGINTQYEYFIGKKKKNSLSIDISYIYGKKTYRKSYSADWGSVEYVGTFENSPFWFGLGYSFYF